jgi:hypothetical protein
MATAIAPRGGDEIKLEYGVPQVVAFRFVTGKNVAGNYGPRVLFTSVDERKLWLDAEDGSDLERGLRDLGVGPADFVRITKIRGVHGGGHSLRVERHGDAADAHGNAPGISDIERQLAASIAALEAAKREREKAAAAPISAPAATPIQKEEKNPGVQPGVQQSNGPITQTTARMCAAFCVAIDAMHEARAYAARQGFGAINFTSEDLRAVALTAFIQDAKGGAR